MTPQELVAMLLVLGGLVFTLVAAIGLHRLPDCYTRTHATSKSDTLGALLTLAGAALAVGTGNAAFKLTLLLVFLFLTSPTASHAISRAAYRQGIVPWRADEEVVDD